MNNTRAVAGSRGLSSGQPHAGLLTTWGQTAVEGPPNARSARYATVVSHFHGCSSDTRPQAIRCGTRSSPRESPMSMSTNDTSWLDALCPPGVRPGLSALRRDLHQHPELAFQESRSAALLERELNAIGAASVQRVAGTGVIARIRGRTKG